MDLRLLDLHNHNNENVNDKDKDKDTDKAFVSFPLPLALHGQLPITSPHALPNNPPSTSIAISPPPVQAAKQRRHRNKFDEVRRSETAATRKEGACKKCRKSGTRCHKSHRQGLNPPSTPSLNPPSLSQNGASSSAAIAFPPAQHGNNYYHQQDSSIHRFMEDPNNSQRLIQHFAPRHFRIGGEGGFNSAGDRGAFVLASGGGSQQINSVAPTRPYPHHLSNSYSSSGNTIVGHLPHSQPVAGPGSFFPGAVATSHPGPLPSSNKVTKQSYAPLGRRQYGGQSRSIWRKPPSIVSLPPQYEGLTQIADENYSLHNPFPPQKMTARQPPSNPFQLSHAGSQFESMGSADPYQPSSAAYVQSSNPPQSPFSTPIRQGYDNTSSFGLNTGSQPQLFRDQTDMYNQGVSFDRNMQPSLPSSYQQTFANDNTFGIPPIQSSQAHGHGMSQFSAPPDDLLLDHVLDFELNSIFNGQPLVEPSTSDSSHYNTLAPPAAATQLPIRLASNNNNTTAIGDFDQPRMLDYLYSDDDGFGDEFGAL